MTDQPYLEQPEVQIRAPHRAAQLIHPPNMKEALRVSRTDPKKTMFGIGHGIPSPFVSKLIASARPDYVWVDVEHGMYNRLTLQDTIHAIHHHSEGATMVIVRVPPGDELMLNTALDSGAAGIIIPHVEEPEQVTKMIQHMYYPPIGTRSFSPWVFAPGVSDVSLYANDDFNMATSNRHIAVIAQIESVKGVQNTAKIAATPGLDAMFFGPGDFMADAGIPVTLKTLHPTLMKGMMDFSAAGAAAGIPLMGGTMSAEQIPMMVQSGYRMVTVAMDVWAIAGMIKGKIGEGRGALAKATAEENGQAKEANGA